MWRDDVEEGFDEHVQRSGRLLDEVFEGPEEVSALVAHSGSIRALFGAVAWRKVPVGAGAVYPLVVCRERVGGEV